MDLSVWQQNLFKVFFLILNQYSESHYRERWVTQFHLKLLYFKQVSKNLNVASKF